MRRGGPLHHGNFTSRWLIPAVAACADYGVDQRLRAHGFRHTHAAWLLSAGRPVTSVQKRLGHENALTTTKIYGHHIGEVDAGDLNVVDGVLDGLVTLDRDDEDVTALTRPELFALHPADAAMPLLDDHDEDEDDLADEAA